MRSALALCITIFSLCLPLQFASAESITSNDIQLELFKQGNLEIRERVVWDFGEGAQKHGIIRDIPIGAVPGSSDEVLIMDFAVRDEVGNAYNFDETGDASEKSYKIGDAEVYVSGEKTYNISYGVQNGLGYFPDLTEIYWNLIGTAWTVPTKQISASIVLPAEINPQLVKVYCGFSRQKEECATYDIAKDAAGEKNIITFTVKEEYLPLPPRYGITVAVAFPRGFIMTEPTAEKIRNREIIHYISYVFFAFPLFITYVLIRKKLARRRAWKKYLASHSLIVQYDAGGFSPLQAGIIFNEDSRYANIASEITFLIAEGYLDANEDKDGQTAFARLPRSDDRLLPHQKLLLDELAGKGELALKLTFYKTMMAVFDGVFDNLIHRNIFDKKQTARLKRMVHIGTGGGSAWGMFGVAAFLAVNPGIFIFIFMGWRIGYVWSVSCVLVGLANVFFRNKYKLSFSEEGLRAKWHILGLYTYIEKAEKEKIVFDANPEVTLDIAEKLLPYAIVFGMEKKWVEYLTQMLDMTGFANTDRTRYEHHASRITSFATQSALVGSLSASVISANTRSSSRSGGSRSSGSSSGSSGGGGGGGGGSSW